MEIIYCAPGPRDSRVFKALDTAFEVLGGFPFMDDTVIRKLQEKERIADLITDGEELELDPQLGI